MLISPTETSPAKRRTLSQLTSTRTESLSQPVRVARLAGSEWRRWCFCRAGICVFVQIVMLWFKHVHSVSPLEAQVLKSSCVRKAQSLAQLFFTAPGPNIMSTKTHVSWKLELLKKENIKINNVDISFLENFFWIHGQHTNLHYYFFIFLGRGDVHCEMERHFPFQFIFVLPYNFQFIFTCITLSFTCFD